MSESEFGVSGVVVLEVWVEGLQSLCMDTLRNLTISLIRLTHGPTTGTAHRPQTPSEATKHLVNPP